MTRTIFLVLGAVNVMINSVQPSVCYQCVLLYCGKVVKKKYGFDVALVVVCYM